MTFNSEIAEVAQNETYTAAVDVGTALTFEVYKYTRKNVHK